jgi:APA family basic amino acid/polyamine antiporter
MIGAGVFAALGPAARAAGNGLLIGLLIAAFVAYCNATSSAQLAAIHPESGGTYVYGRKRLGPFVGYLAGWAFVVGKLASCSAMALTFGYYASPDLARPLAVGAVLALAAVNYFGVQKTAALTRVIVALVLASLAVVVCAALLGGQADADRITPLVEDDYDLTGILQAAGLLFFAFAGYARIATLGEEVANPRTTIPRAIPIALGVTLLVYGTVAVASLATIGSQGLAQADAPLTAVVKAGDLSELAPVVRVGATVASLGVLLSLMVGISRTLFSMAANGDMPRVFDHVHPRYKVPDHAEVAVAACVALVVLFVDVRGAIGFSSFGVLLYYGIANACAFTLNATERRSPRVLAIAGVIGCVVLALSLPWESIAVGSAVVTAGAFVYAVRSRRR